MGTAGHGFKRKKRFLIPSSCARNLCKTGKKQKQFDLKNCFSVFLKQEYNKTNSYGFLLNLNKANPYSNAEDSCPITVKVLICILF